MPPSFTSGVAADFAAASSFVNAHKYSDLKMLDSQKLELYALYKQACEGDASEVPPQTLAIVRRSKWSAWATLRGTPEATAMEEYINLVDHLSVGYSRKHSTPLKRRPSMLTSPPSFERVKGMKEGEVEGMEVGELRRVVEGLREEVTRVS